MIWQENVSQIVMLTNLMEGKKVPKVDNCHFEWIIILKNHGWLIKKLFFSKAKCVQYWPDLEADINCDVFTINATDERQYAFYAIRKMKIRHTMVMSFSYL